MMFLLLELMNIGTMRTEMKMKMIIRIFDTFHSRWLQDMHPHVKQIGDLPALENNVKYIVVYAELESLNVESHQNNFLKLIDGTINLRCHDHADPLITSSGFEKYSLCKIRKNIYAAIGFVAS